MYKIDYDSVQSTTIFFELAIKAGIPAKDIGKYLRNCAKDGLEPNFDIVKSYTRYSIK